MTPLMRVGRALLDQEWGGKSDSDAEFEQHGDYWVNAATAAITALRTLAREQGEERVDLWLEGMLEVDRG